MKVFKLVSLMLVLTAIALMFAFTVLNLTGSPVVATVCSIPVTVIFAVILSRV